MPELPEVETIRRGLENNVLFKRIENVTVGLPKIVRGDLSQFQAVIIGNQFTNISRRAKLLIFHLKKSEPQYLLIHLKMTGQLIYPTDQTLIAGGHPYPDFKSELPNKYTHLMFHFQDQSTLFFNDLRQFGYTQLATTDQLSQLVNSYGLEPGTPSFTWQAFKEKIDLRKRPVKSWLLDQQEIAGLGNIYADEVCFQAGILPNRNTGTLNDSQKHALYQAIKNIISQAIKHRGTTFRNYADHEGKKGGYAKFLQVYGRAEEKCFKCGSIIQKTKVAGRGTHYCPVCQQ